MNKIRKPYLKVGRLKATITQEALLKCADIYVFENQIKHIENKHCVELEQLEVKTVQPRNTKHLLKKRRYGNPPQGLGLPCPASS